MTIDAHECAAVIVELCAGWVNVPVGHQRAQAHGDLVAARTGRHQYVGGHVAPVALTAFNDEVGDGAQTFWTLEAA